jgi:hypothetical protein
MAIQLIDNLNAFGITQGAGIVGLIENAALPITIESDRLYTPAWDEAFVDMKAIVRPDTYALLCSTPKWLFNEAKPCAFAVRGAHGGLILVSEGLIQLIAFCACHAGIASIMAQRGMHEEGLIRFEDTFLHIITNHAEHGWPLPEAIEVTSADAYRQIVVHRDCMTALVLLHELGHIVLGHLEGRTVGPVDFVPRLPDLDSDRHDAEIAADDFAFRAFVNSEALLVATTLLNTWSYVEAGRRLTRGPDAHLSLTHPLSINRLSHLANCLAQITSAQAIHSGVDLALTRTAAIVEDPTNAGLEARAFSIEEGIKRHHQLLDEHRGILTPFT